MKSRNTHTTLIHLWGLRLLEHGLRQTATPRSRFQCRSPDDDLESSLSELFEDESAKSLFNEPAPASRRSPGTKLEQQIAALLALPDNRDARALRGQILQKLQSGLRTGGRRLKDVPPLDALASPIRENLRALSALLGLSSEETMCLSFLALLASEPELKACVDCLDSELDDRAADAAIAAAVALPADAVRTAFSTNGRLASSLLIKRDHSLQRLSG